MEYKKIKYDILNPSELTFIDKAPSFYAVYQSFSYSLLTTTFAYKLYFIFKAKTDITIMSPILFILLFIQDGCLCCLFSVLNALQSNPARNIFFRTFICFVMCIGIVFYSLLLATAFTSLILTGLKPDFSMALNVFKRWNEFSSILTSGMQFKVFLGICLFIISTTLAIGTVGWVYSTRFFKASTSLKFKSVLLIFLFIFGYLSRWMEFGIPWDSLKNSLVIDFTNDSEKMYFRADFPEYISPRPIQDLDTSSILNAVTNNTVLIDDFSFLKRNNDSEIKNVVFIFY